jgi:phage host-nuclease inhibitor protein Gam
LTRKKIKEEIREKINDSQSFEAILHNVSIYIFDNYIRRKKPIDSEALLKRKKKG